MRRHYCCYFDHRYLPRGLAMIRSLRRFEQGAEIWVLCLSELCHDVLARIAEPGMRLVRLPDLEVRYPDLKQARANRSLVEYYFTCTPSLIRYVMDFVDEGELVTYVDGDLFFFSEPEPLFEELGSGSIGIIPHRFAERLRHLERYGIYNVGWLTFRKDGIGLKAVEWWRSRCNEWCYDLLEGDRFADQKYLDRFPELFEGVVVLRHVGANLAPWNLGQHGLSVREGHVVVDGNSPLVFFHFHGVRPFGSYIYVAEHWSYGVPLNRLVRRQVYWPYIQAVGKITKEVKKLLPSSTQPLVRAASGRRGVLSGSLGRLRRSLKNLIAVLAGNFIVVVNGRVVW